MNNSIQCLINFRVPSVLPKLFKNFVLLLSISIFIMLNSISAHAAENKKYASLVMDADTGVIISERYADKTLHPASLTKIMTLLMVFDALETGQASLNDRVRISNRAAAAVPSKLGLPAGSSIRLKDAILALVTKSANDIAVAVAEHIGGSESKFARLSTNKARQIGMYSTNFVNPHGLHNPRQVTTARDMAKLARYIIYRYPQYYSYFSTRSFTYNGKTYNNHNRLLGKYDGMDGMKTGFINASGFNLVASVKRGNRRVIGVVFGGRTAASRNAHMVEILDAAWNRLPRVQIAIANPPRPTRKPYTGGELASLKPQVVSYNTRQNDPIAAVIAQGDSDPKMNSRLETGYIAMDAHLNRSKGVQLASTRSNAKVIPQQRGWSIQIGAFQSRVATEAALKTAKSLLPGSLRYADEKVVPLRTANSKWVYRARLTGYTRSDAENACKQFKDCMTISPKAQ